MENAASYGVDCGSIKRAQQPEDVVGATLFLASDSRRFYQRPDARHGWRVTVHLSQRRKLSIYTPPTSCMRGGRLYTNR